MSSVIVNLSPEKPRRPLITAEKLWPWLEMLGRLGLHILVQLVHFSKHYPVSGWVLQLDTT